MKIILLSGKRYTGKDTVANIIKEVCPDKKIECIAMANQCKILFARKEKLDADRLINDRAYKEQYRDKLTAFCLSTLEMDRYVFDRFVVDKIKSLNADTDVAIITDMRTKWNLQYFMVHLDNCITVRINVPNEIRKSRGWVESEYDSNFVEVDLDTYDKWNYVIHNDKDFDNLKSSVSEMMASITQTGKIEK